METLMKNITVCKHCGQHTQIKRNQDMTKAKCQHCKKSLISNFGMGHFLCNCGTILTPKSKFAWKKINCHSCGATITHPSLSHKGGKPDRGEKYPEMLTIKCTKETKKAIQNLVKKMNTTQGAVTRHLLNISLDLLQ